MSWTKDSSEGQVVYRRGNITLESQEQIEAFEKAESKSWEDRRAFPLEFYHEDIDAFIEDEEPSWIGIAIIIILVLFALAGSQHE